MPLPLDPAALPDNILALRRLVLHREEVHAAERAQQVAELNAARIGLKEQVLRNELLKARLARLLRERFGASSEKLRGEIEQLELLLGDLEEQLAETAPPELEEGPAEPAVERQRRKPARKPLPQHLPRDTIEHPAPCTCPRCGGSLLSLGRPLGEDVTEVLEYVPGAFRVTRHVRPKLSCRCCEAIAQAPAPQPAPLPRHGRAGAAGACAGGQILRPSTTVSPS